MKRIALLIAAGAVAVAVVVPLAHGHATDRSYHPRDPSWAQVREHRWIEICDWHKDGHAVYVRYHLDYPTLRRIDFRAGYAPSQGCDTWLSAYGFSISTWVVCVQYEGCGAVHRNHHTW